MRKLILISFLTLNMSFGQNLDSIFNPLKFRNIGPFRGGRSNSGSGVIGDKLTYYMGTTGGGVWKTSDAGQHWRNISDGYFSTGSVGAISVSPSDPDIIYVGMGESHPALYKNALFVKSNEIHWIREDLKINENETMNVEFRIRYRQPLQSGTIYRFKKGLYILFDKPISSVTSGQFVSWYIDNELIGSGIIN